MADPNDVVSRDLRHFELSGDLEGILRAEGAEGSDYAGPGEAEESEEYWTDERMARARPVPLADAAEEGNARKSRPSSASVAERVGLDDAEAARFRTERVQDANQSPYRAVGKLFMTFDGEDSWASAWLAAPRIVVTAGHCLYDHRRTAPWADKVVFVPRYGSDHAGSKIAATRLHVLAGWHDRRPDMYVYDLAAATLGSPLPAGDTLTWVPDLERRDEPFESIGYPYSWLSPQYDFDGTRMWSCRGGYAGGTNPVVMVNNMTEGCSGGPWLVRRAGTLQVGGVNSYRPEGQESGVQSPRLGRGLANLLAAG